MFLFIASGVSKDLMVEKISFVFGFFKHFWCIWYLRVVTMALVSVQRGSEPFFTGVKPSSEFCIAHARTHTSTAQKRGEI